MKCGIDEAGRGPAMGPLVVCAVYCDSDTEFIEMGAKDSKKLSPKRREELYDIITSDFKWKTVVASAEEIDERRKTKDLNTIELEMFAEAGTVYGTEIIIADCPDPNTDRFSARLSDLTGRKAEGYHGADNDYPVVSAASIIAKVTRDRMMEDICKEFGVEYFSGYLGDPFTMKFIEQWIKENGVAPPHTRTSWEPVRKLLSDSKVRKLTDWIS